MVKKKKEEAADTILFSFHFEISFSLIHYPILSKNRIQDSRGRTANVKKK